MTTTEIVAAIVAQPTRVTVFPVAHPERAREGVRRHLARLGLWYALDTRLAILPGELIVYNRAVQP